ncbi:MAG: phosphoenolpyruvate--protein phosphotransferase [Planctomycetes bacterium]|nr:phosphoenolpyruvate--protein phosphotransferase [Planctomycetota bacterium]
MERIKGIAASPGIVWGKVLLLGKAETHVPRRTISESEVAGELEKLNQTREVAARALIQLRQHAERELGTEAAKIFAFHEGMLNDRSLIDPIEQSIRSGRQNVEAAVNDQFQKLSRQFRSMGNEIFAAKADDILDLQRRVLGLLMGEEEDRLERLNEPTIVVAHELTPSQVAAVPRSKVIAFVTEAGGLTGHTSIVFRAMGVPAIVGCQDIAKKLQDGDEIIVDGDAGEIVLKPNAEIKLAFEKRAAEIAKVRLLFEENDALEAVTTDGTRIMLLGNIEFPAEVESVLKHGGDGVGLYRTEFLFLTSDKPPDEEEQFQAYKNTVEMLKGRPCTLRTLDLGADKMTQGMLSEPERNPFLGLRSIRYSLQHQPMFKTQLRAILRASAFGPVRIMFPLVSTLMELRQAKLIVRDVMEELEEEGIAFDPQPKIGIMIEVPSAALMARTFATEADFFSIGTNDLVQYTLAVDRGNERVANLYTAASPAVLYLVKNVIRAGRYANIETSLCGEIAGDPVFTMLLIGMGLRTLSVVPGQIPAIKRVIRSVNLELCERLARKVGSFDSERQIHTSLRDELRKLDPANFGGWATA